MRTVCTSVGGVEWGLFSSWVRDCEVTRIVGAGEWDIVYYSSSGLSDGRRRGAERGSRGPRRQTGMLFRRGTSLSSPTPPARCVCVCDRVFNHTHFEDLSGSPKRAAVQRALRN